MNRFESTARFIKETAIKTGKTVIRLGMPVLAVATSLNNPDIFPIKDIPESQRPGVMRSIRLMPQTVNAQGICEGDLIVIGLGFIDASQVNGRGVVGVIDPLDFHIGSPTFDRVKITTQRPGSNQGTEIASANLENRGEYQFTKFERLRGECNTKDPNGGDALAVTLSFDNDPDGKKYTEVLLPRRIAIHVAQRELRNNQVLVARVARADRYPINYVGAAVESAVKAETGKILGSFDMSQNNPARNAEELRNYLTQIGTQVPGRAIPTPSPVAQSKPEASPTTSVQPKPAGEAQSKPTLTQLYADAQRNAQEIVTKDSVDQKKAEDELKQAQENLAKAKTPEEKEKAQIEIIYREALVNRLNQGVGTEGPTGPVTPPTEQVHGINTIGGYIHEAPLPAVAGIGNFFDFLGNHVYNMPVPVMGGTIRWFGDRFSDI